MSTDSLGPELLDFASIMAKEKAEALALTAPILSPILPIMEKKKSFLNQQFILFSIPNLIIYLQGPIALPPSTASLDPVENAFINASCRLKGTNLSLLSTDQRELLEELRQNKALLYTDKNWHASLLQRLIDAGFTCSMPLVANRTRLLSTLTKYQEALAVFLEEQGASDVADYYTRKASAKHTPLTADAMAQALLDL